MTTVGRRGSTTGLAGAAPGGRVRRWWRSYRLLLAAAWRSQFQYRANLLVMLVAGAAYQGIGLAFIWAVVARFGAIGGWSLSDIAFVYGVRLAGHGLFVVFAGQIFLLDTLIQEGEFDRYMTRPVGVLTQLLTRFVYLPQLGDLLSGIAILVVAATSVSVAWNPLTVGYVVLAVLAGAMIEAALQILVASFAFRRFYTRSLRAAMDDVFTNFAGYPVKIFPALARLLLTFVIPLAFLAYFPSSVLVGRGATLYVPEWLAAASPALGPLLLAVAYTAWRRQMRHYSSSGT